MNWQKLWLAIWIGVALLTWGLLGDSVFRYDLPKTLASPSLLFPAGFDAFGRNMLPLVLRASLLSLGFSFFVVILATVLAIFLGAGLALAPARMRGYGTHALEGLLVFPSLIIGLSWAAIRGPGWSTLLVALFIGILPSFTRLLYLRAREILVEDYVEAAKALGAGRIRILVRYLVPGLVSLSAVKFPALFAETLVAEATLSFLGIGAPIGQDTWGSLLAQAKDYLIEAPHLAIATGIPLVLTILALQGLSERLEFRLNS